MFVFLCRSHHLLIDNIFGSVWVIRSWLRACIQLRSLTLVNWRMRPEEAEEAMLSFTNFCPESLELDTGFVIEPSPSAECLAQAKRHDASVGTIARNQGENSQVRRKQKRCEHFLCLITSSSSSSPFCKIERITTTITVLFDSFSFMSTVLLLQIRTM